MDLEALKKKQAEAFERLQTKEATDTFYSEAPSGQDLPSVPEMYGSGTEREARKDRAELLEKIFASMPSAKAQARGEMGSLFDEFSAMQTRSPLLAKTASADTLTSRVARLVRK